MPDPCPHFESPEPLFKPDGPCKYWVACDRAEEFRGLAPFWGGFCTNRKVFDCDTEGMRHA